MKINPGDYIHTPRFLKVQIKEVFGTEDALRSAGFTEPTYFRDDDHVVLGKSLDIYHMEFAAGRKAK